MFKDTGKKVVKETGGFSLLEVRQFCNEMLFNLIAKFFRG